MIARHSMASQSLPSCDQQSSQSREGVQKGPLLDAFALKHVRCKARELVGKAGFKESDQDDIQQQLILALHEQREQYELTPLSHNTFVRCVVKQRISRLLAHQRAQKRHYARCRSLGDFFDKEGHERQDSPLEDKTFRREKEKEQLEYAVEDVLEKMPKRLREVCNLLKLRSPRELAPTKAERLILDSAIAEIRPYFEKAGFRPYRCK